MIVIVDIFTRHTIKLRIFCALISCYGQFFSENHHYDIVNHCLQHFDQLRTTTSIVYGKMDEYNLILTIFMVSHHSYACHGCEGPATIRNHVETPRNHRNHLQESWNHKEFYWNHKESLNIFEIQMPYSFVK